MEELNGYNNLPNALKEKLRQYDFSTNTPIRVFFTREEFRKIFECVTALFSPLLGLGTISTLLTSQFCHEFTINDIYAKIQIGRS